MLFSAKIVTILLGITAFASPVPVADQLVHHHLDRRAPGPRPEPAPYVPLLARDDHNHAPLAKPFDIEKVIKELHDIHDKAQNGFIEFVHKIQKAIGDLEATHTTPASHDHDHGHDQNHDRGLAARHNDWDDDYDESDEVACFLKLMDAIRTFQKHCDDDEDVSADIKVLERLIVTVLRIIDRLVGRDTCEHECQHNCVSLQSILQDLLNIIYGAQRPPAGPVGPGVVAPAPGVIAPAGPVSGGIIGGAVNGLLGGPSGGAVGSLVTGLVGGQTSGPVGGATGAAGGGGGVVGQVVTGLTGAPAGGSGGAVGQLVDGLLGAPAGAAAAPAGAVAAPAGAVAAPAGAAGAAAATGGGLLANVVSGLTGAPPSGPAPGTGGALNSVVDGLLG